MTAALITGIVLLLFMGLPLYIALFGMSGVLFQTLPDHPLVAAVISFQKLESQEFISAIPLFTFAGYTMARSRTPGRIVNLFSAAFCGIRGSESAIVILIMAFFTALTGASGVSILALGALMMPLLSMSGKGERFSLGLITSSGSSGLLLAPSLPVIIYALISTQNNSPVQIQLLFTAALLPSILRIGSGIVYAIAKGSTSAVKNTRRFSFPVLLGAVKDARWIIPIPFLVYGGIYSGIFTVMEAAAVTALYVFIMEFFLYRDITLRAHFTKITVESMKLTGAIFIIMACAFIFTNFLIHRRIPEQAFAVLAPYIKSKMMFLLMVNIFLLLTGCLLDIFSAIMIVLPILLPIVASYGINPYHFAMIFLINLEMGYMTPPVGMNLFIASYRFKKPITDLYKASVPFLGIMFLVLMLITYVPVLSEFTLPGALRAGPDVSPPARITDLALHAAGPDSLTITFTAPGSDGTSGTAEGYLLRYSEMDIPSDTEFDFGYDVVSAESYKPKSAGQLEKFTITDLVPGTVYYIAVKAFDKNENYSTLSPVLCVSTENE